MNAKATPSSKSEGRRSANPDVAPKHSDNRNPTATATRPVIITARPTSASECRAPARTSDRNTEPSLDPDVTRIPKPGVNARLLARSLRPTRSIVHGRYDADAFVSAIDESISDVYVAEHSYMAEPFIRSAKYGSPFVINTVNTESQVWKVTRGFAGRIEAPRILRDEIRVARAADAVGTYDAEEAEMYRANGVRDARWIDLTLEPAPRLDSSETEKRLVFMGTRGWPPNQEAFKIALQYWPAISAGIEVAELCIIGAKADGATDPDYPEGVRDLGFVDDLQESSAPVAPSSRRSPPEVEYASRFSTLQARVYRSSEPPLQWDLSARSSSYPHSTTRSSSSRNAVGISSTATLLSKQVNGCTTSTPNGGANAPRTHPSRH